MGARCSRPVDPHHTQDDNALDPYSKDLERTALDTSGVPVEGRLCDKKPASFPIELPEWPLPKPSHLSFTKRKPSFTTLAPTTLHNPPQPVSPPLSPLTAASLPFTAKPTLDPFHSTNCLSALLTPPTSPIVLPAGKPLFAHALHSIQPSPRCTSELLAQGPVPLLPQNPPKRVTGPTSSACASLSDIDPLVDPLALRLIELRLHPSRPVCPHRPSPSTSAQSELLYSSLESTDMAGPARRRSRRLVRKEPDTPPLVTDRKIPPKRTRSNLADCLGMDAETDSRNPRKSRHRNDRLLSEGGISLELAKDVSYPDVARWASEAASFLGQTVPNEISDSPMSNGVSSTPGALTPTSVDDIDWGLVEYIQQTEREEVAAEACQVHQTHDEQILGGLCFPEDQLPRKSAPPAGTPSNNLYDDGLFVISTRASSNGGTYNNPITLSSDSDSEHRGWNDAQLARRLEQEYYEELVLVEHLRRQQQESDAAMAWRLQNEEEAEEKRREEFQTRMRDCVVCGDPFLAYTFPSLANCSHEPEVCNGCFSEWIAAGIKDGNWREIKCPGIDCGLVLCHHEIKELASPEAFAELDTLLFRDALSGDPNFRWCRAPGCQSGQIHESGEEGYIFRCNACGFRVCVVHDNTWHEGETCQEYDYRISGDRERDERRRLEAEQEEASMNAVGKLSKKCPGVGCGWNIEKNQGCDHMTCSKCRHEFCWVCLASYGPIRTSGNAAHNCDCKYHSDRIT